MSLLLYIDLGCLPRALNASLDNTEHISFSIYECFIRTKHRVLNDFVTCPARRLALRALIFRTSFLCTQYD
jgi:hypothetical protein